MRVNSGKILERAATSGAAGVSAAAVQVMIDEMFRSGIDIHSLMILRGGKVACEAWRRPLYPESVHMVYSVSKSFTATAFGFAVDEGFLTMETKFLDIFPEYRGARHYKKLEQLKILDLIAMTSGKRTPLTNKKEADWMKAFVHAGWDFAPGEEWRYVNENYYAAAAAIVRVTGMSLSEFLTPRLYEPLGISIPQWEACPNGIEAGGWGLSLTTEDMAKFILCYHNGGIFNGRRVIPEWWVKEAVKKQSDTSSSQVKADSRAGYGYGFWRCAGAPNTYRCEGMYSQYGISLADYDACVVMTGAHTNVQETLDVLWRHLDSIFIEANPAFEAIKIEMPPYECLPESRVSPLQKEIDSTTYALRRKLFLNLCGFPVSSIPIPGIYFATERGGNINNVSFSFDDDGCLLSWTEMGKYENNLRIGMNGKYAKGSIRIGTLTFETRSCGVWREDNVLEISIRPLAVVAERILTFTFNGKNIVMKPDTIPSVDEKIKTLGDMLKCILKGRFFEWWIDFLVPKISRIIHPKHKGKQINPGR